MNSSKRLCRSRSNRMLAGVCGGLAEYFGLDVTLIRILVVIIPGINLVTYLIAAILMPEEESGAE